LISVLQLGTLDYATGLQLQQKLVHLRKEGRIGDVLLLLEHTPVITLGRNAIQKNIIASPELLAKCGVEVCQCDRGGDVTFHGPGQLVGYPIFDLRGLPSSQANRKSLGAIEYVRSLEEALIRTCAGFGIPSGRVTGLTGVWTQQEGSEPGSAGPDSREAKIAAIGVHISSGVTSHGFALNVNTDLDYFNLIIPCGIPSKPVTSIAAQLGKPLPLEEVAHAISRNFGRVFASQILWLDSLEALLSQNMGVPMKPPAELRKLHEEEETFLA
jgi:lipoyl(octanoyl) transferase